MARFGLKFCTAIGLFITAGTLHAVPLDYSFSYQGRLTADSADALGLYDFQICLFDSTDGAVPLDCAPDFSDVPVEDGLFALQLDFGAMAFMGEERFLEIRVREATESGYTILSPRQLIRRVPEATHAAFVAWEGIEGIPADIADGDADSGGTVTSVSAGSGLLGGPITTSGSLSLDTSAVQLPTTAACTTGTYLTSINPDGSTLCSAITGVDPDQNFSIDTRGGDTFRITPSTIDDFSMPAQPASASVIAGSPANTVSAGVEGATIGGGGAQGPDLSDDVDTTEGPNSVIGDFGTVAGGVSNSAGAAGAVGGGGNNAATGDYDAVMGGRDNTASGGFGFVGGGTANLVSAFAGTVSGGTGNVASTDRATVVGGENNEALGRYSTVGGGTDNCAGGDYSWAGGRAAKIAYSDTKAPLSGFSGCSGAITPVADAAGHAGVFMWADSQNAQFLSEDSDAFYVRAQNGIWLGTGGSPLTPSGRFINTSTGAFLSTGGTWTNSSSRVLKTGFRSIQPQTVLQKLLDLPILEWQYKASSEEGVHVGTMAEDFHSAFGLGDTNTAIGTVDADGIAFAAIQGLNEKLEQQNQQLREDAETLRKRIARLEALVEQIELQQ